MNISDLSITQLKKAVSLKERIAKLQAQLENLTGTAAAETAVPKKRKGGMSAAGRARVAAAQKARWAKLKAGQKTENKAKK